MAEATEHAFPLTSSFFRANQNFQVKLPELPPSRMFAMPPLHLKPLTLIAANQQELVARHSRQPSLRVEADTVEFKPQIPPLRLQPQEKKIPCFSGSSLPPVASFLPGFTFARPSFAPPSAAPKPAAPRQSVVRSSFNSDHRMSAIQRLRDQSGLGVQPVLSVLRHLRDSAHNDSHDRKSFGLALCQILPRSPEPSVVDAIFELFDKDGNKRVDYLELISGVALLCGGSEEEKLSAAFSLFDSDNDGFISMTEMVSFLTSVFRVVLTPAASVTMRTLGVSVDGAEDLAAATALECFRSADKNKDGRISLSEFQEWFDAPNRKTLL